MTEALYLKWSLHLKPREFYFVHFKKKKKLELDLKNTKPFCVKHHYSQLNDIVFLINISECGSGTCKLSSETIFTVSLTKPGTLSISVCVLKSKDYFGFGLDFLRSQPCVFPASALLLRLLLPLPFVFLFIPRKIACHGQNQRDYAQDRWWLFWMLRYTLCSRLEWHEIVGSSSHRLK